MVECAKPRVPRQRPSKDQYKFLETLRDLGPQDNAQTAAVRKATKRACQVRGWIEWRSLDQIAGVKAWHLTIIGGRGLNSLARRVDNPPSAQPPHAPTPVPGKLDCCAAGPIHSPYGACQLAPPATIPGCSIT